MSRQTTGSTTTAAAILRQRAEALAAPAEQEQATGHSPALLFRVGEQWFAVDVSHVREIFQDLSVTRLPCVPGHVVGVVNVRGEIISVTDPARLLGLSSGAVQVDQSTPAIVLNSDGVVTALVVDEIGDIAQIDPTDYEAASGIVDRVQAAYLTACVFYEGAMIGVLAADRVLEPVVANHR